VDLIDLGGHVQDLQGTRIKPLITKFNRGLSANLPLHLLPLAAGKQGAATLGGGGGAGDLEGQGTGWMARDAEERKGIAKEDSPAAEINGRRWFSKGAGLTGRRLGLQARMVLRRSPGDGKRWSKLGSARGCSWWGRFAPGMLQSGESTSSQAAPCDPGGGGSVGRLAFGGGAGDCRAQAGR
jgi:hypothetical protein